MIKLTLLCSLLICNLAFSQAQQQLDLQLTYETNPPMPWRVGQEGTLISKVTNLSPTLHAHAIVEFFDDEPDPAEDVFQYAGPIPGLPGCPPLSECEQFEQMCLDFGVVPPGGYRDCGARIRAIEKRQVPAISREVAFHYLNFYLDPDLSNNTVIETLSISAEPIAVPMSPVAWAGLSLILLAFGAVRLRAMN